jgi:hypothetical protein
MDKEPKQKVLLCPYQVTLHRGTHKDSHELFFKEDFSEWRKLFTDFEMEIEFLWFTGDPSSYENHSYASPQEKSLRTKCVCTEPEAPQHYERLISFEDLDKSLARRYMEAQKKVNEEKAQRKAEREMKEAEKRKAEAAAKEEAEEKKAKKKAEAAAKRAEAAAARKKKAEEKKAPAPAPAPAPAKAKKKAPAPAPAPAPAKAKKKAPATAARGKAAGDG